MVWFILCKRKIGRVDVDEIQSEHRTVFTYSKAVQDHSHLQIENEIEYTFNIYFIGST